MRNPPPIPIALQFDGIELDPARAPTRAAIERALAFAAPASAEPGFYLLDDAGGRFQVDRDFGVVSLKDERVLAREAGAVHAVRLHVIEPSGAKYELTLKLRLTGLVPQMVGGEEDDFLLGELRSSSVADKVPESLGVMLVTTPFGEPPGVSALLELEGEAAFMLARSLPALARADAQWSL